MSREELATVLFLEYVVLDGILTYIGLKHIDGVVESNPVIIAIMDRVGMVNAILISSVMTTIAIALLYGLSKVDWSYKAYDYVLLAVMTIMAAGGVILVVNNAVLVASG